MRNRKIILFSLIILKNAILKKKYFITINPKFISFDILTLFKQVGLVLNFYKLPCGQIKILFTYAQGEPAWKIKTNLTKTRISKYKKNYPIYKSSFIKGSLYISNTTKGLKLHNQLSPVCYNGEIICVFTR